MKTLKRHGFDAFARIANKIGATLTFKNEAELNFSEECKNDSEFHLWHFDYGRTVIQSPNNKSLVGFVISSALSEEETNLRTKIHDFSHIGIYNKKNKEFFVYKSSKKELHQWEENLDRTEDLKTFFENQIAENPDIPLCEDDDEDDEEV